MAQKAGWLVKVQRANGKDMWEFRHSVEQPDGSVKLRKQIACSLADYPTREKAEKSKEVAKIRLGLNGCSSMGMVELIAHYRKNGMNHLAHSTKHRLEHTLRVIEHRWSSEQVMKISTKMVQIWLDGLNLAPESKSKLRNTMCSLYSHAIREGFFGTNQLTGEQIQYNPVRGPYKKAGVYLSVHRLRKPDVLAKDELASILLALPLRERVAVRLANLGLRRSEIRGLQWWDFEFEQNRFTVNRSMVDGVVGKPKTEASAESVVMDEHTKADLSLWQKTTLYSQPDDYVFSASKGAALDLTAMLRRHILPVAEKVAPTKTVGWHTFRRTFATRLVTVIAKDNVKTAQSLMRHANSAITLNLYAQGDEELKRAAVDALAIPFASEMVQ